MAATAGASRRLHTITRKENVAKGHERSVAPNGKTYNSSRAEFAFFPCILRANSADTWVFHLAAPNHFRRVQIEGTNGKCRLRLRATLAFVPCIALITISIQRDSKERTTGCVI